MAVTASPIFTQTPRLVNQQLTVGNTNKDGVTGTYSGVVAPGANGSIVDWIKFKAAGNTTAGMLRIFYNDGTSYRLLDEISTNGATPSATVQAESFLWTPPGGLPMNLPAAATGLRFSVNNSSETWNVLTHLEDF